MLATTRARRAWSGLPEGVRGAAWMLAAVVSMSVQGAAVKAAGESIPSIQITFARCAFGLVLVLPMMRREVASILRPARFRLHFGRVVAGLLSMMCGFYALSNMPLVEATALTFTMPLFMLMLATITLGERVGWRRGTATLVGFGGVLVMLRPGAVPIGAAALAALASALFHAVSAVFIKKLAASETTAMILFYFAAIGTVLFLVPAIGVWVAPGPGEWLLLALVAVLGVANQLAFVEAARLAEMSAIVPLDYTRLCFAALLGYAIWSELPGPWAIAGAVLIVASTGFITWREMQLARDAAARPYSQR